MPVPTINSTYSGEKASGYVAAALLSANTIDKGGITVMPNVKFKQVLEKLATGSLIAGSTCDFTDGSSVTLSERVVEPVQLQVNLELCKEKFRKDWDAISMGYSAFDNLPPDFQSFLLSHVIEKVATENESLIWNGVKSGSGGAQFDGLITLATADSDSDVIDVTGASIGAGGVTAANVIDELGKVVDAIPAALYGREDLFIYVSQNVYRAYIRALGGFGTAGVGAAGYDGKGNNQSIGEVMFDGVKIFVANGCPSNYMLATTKENIVFATGLMSDWNKAQVLDMGDLDGSENVRIVLRFTAAVDYIFGGEVVLYTPVA